MSMANDKYGRKSITFTKSGAPSYSNAQTITLRYGNKEYFITIEPVTGKVNFKK
ncbi:hypothetical protein HMPREF0629_00680 [Peptoniphilus sp. oral taxon 386 str. F0131]|nr:hypothetical protein HMPREF0629_00680 [Peptoniphilus sp. oral taxon 386 str. F0131]